MASMSSGDESLRLCVFDLRRGQTEGQELDKILFFHPPELDVSTQLSVTGLSEGLILLLGQLLLIPLSPRFGLHYFSRYSV